MKKLQNCTMEKERTEKKEAEIKQLRGTLEDEQERLKDSSIHLNQAEQRLKECRENMEILKQLWNKKPLWEEVCLGG